MSLIDREAATNALEAVTAHPDWDSAHFREAVTACMDALDGVPDAQPNPDDVGHGADCPLCEPDWPSA